MRTLRANAFEIGFPEGWTDASTVVMIGPERPTFSPNVQVNQEPVPSGTSVEQYFAEQRRELSELSGFRLHQQGDRMLAGQAVDFHMYSWRVPQGVEIRQLQIALIRGATLFTVTCSALEQDWEMFEPAFEMILSQWRFA